jgi:hypothetical protein
MIGNYSQPEFLEALRASRKRRKGLVHLLYPRWGRQKQMRSHIRWLALIPSLASKHIGTAVTTHDTQGRHAPLSNASFGDRLSERLVVRSPVVDDRRE